MTMTRWNVSKHKGNPVYLRHTDSLQSRFSEIRFYLISIVLFCFEFICTNFDCTCI